MDNETLVRLETKFEQLLEIVQDIKNNIIYDYSKNIKTDITNYLTVAYDSTFSVANNLNILGSFAILDLELSSNVGISFSS